MAFKTLHILNKAPDHYRTRRCLDQLGAGDSLVLIENGTYGLNLLTELPVDNQGYALEADAQARGLGHPQDACMIDYGELVALTASHDRVIHW